ncbi:unnamed protein product [Callosobruchus maculatus]|uniref:Uncharacterized protein n=1 Tax=Callosobruchus maculatus TaxID=64391 RepID=A0A653D6E7_CALMS|nr:unnamed protein product [Callosobruchus maculatus]
MVLVYFLVLAFCITLQEVQADGDESLFRTESIANPVDSPLPKYATGMYILTCPSTASLQTCIAIIPGWQIP